MCLQRECAVDILLCQMAACVVVTCGPLTESLRGHKAQLKLQDNPTRQGPSAAATLHAVATASWLPDTGKPDRNCKHIEGFVHRVSQRLHDSAREVGVRCVLCTEQAAWWCAAVQMRCSGAAVHAVLATSQRIERAQHTVRADACRVAGSALQRQCRFASYDTPCG